MQPDTTGVRWVSSPQSLKLSPILLDWRVSSPQTLPHSSSQLSSFLCISLTVSSCRATRATLLPTRRLFSTNAVRTWNHARRSRPSPTHSFSQLSLFLSLCLSSPSPLIHFHNSPSLSTHSNIVLNYTILSFKIMFFSEFLIVILIFYHTLSEYLHVEGNLLLMFSCMIPICCCTRLFYLAHWQSRSSYWLCAYCVRPVFSLPLITYDICDLHVVIRVVE